MKEVIKRKSLKPIKTLLYMFNSALIAIERRMSDQSKNQTQRPCSAPEWPQNGSGRLTNEAAMSVKSRPGNMTLLVWPRIDKSIILVHYYNKYFCYVRPSSSHISTTSVGLNSCRSVCKTYNRVYVMKTNILI